MLPPAWSCTHGRAHWVSGQLTFLETHTADDVTTCCQSQFPVGTGGKEAAVAADPERHWNSCRTQEQHLIVVLFNLNLNQTWSLTFTSESDLTSAKLYTSYLGPEHNLGDAILNGSKLKGEQKFSQHLQGKNSLFMCELFKLASSKHAFLFSNGALRS